MPFVRPFRNPSGAIVWRLGGYIRGKQIRRNYKSKEEAMRVRDQIIAELQNELEHRLVRTVLDDTELRLCEIAVREAGSADRVLDAVRRAKASEGSSVDWLTAVGLWEAEQEERGIAKVTIVNRVGVFKQFARQTGIRTLGDVTVDVVKKWGATFSPSTRSTYYARIRELVRWAGRRWLFPYPLGALPSVVVPQRLPVVWTPEEAEKVFKASQEYRGGIWSAWFALQMFAGFRPEDTLRWEDYNPDRRVWVLRPGDTKIRQARAVPILAPLAAFLAKVRHLPLACTRRGRSGVCALAGVPWSKDVTRHSYATYRFAAGESRSAIAREMGNSERVLDRHYILQSATDEQARKYFQILC